MTDFPLDGEMPTPETPAQVQAMSPLAMLAPTQIQMLTGIAASPAGNMVILRYETPVGSFAFLVSPEHAKTHANEILKTATQAGTGLLLPPGAQI
jgi:hypothetical protein